MAPKRPLPSSDFDRMVEFVLSKVTKRRPITVEELQRMLYCDFEGGCYFYNGQNLDLIPDVMEYLLYTKRLNIVNPNGQFPVQRNVMENTTFNITKELLRKFQKAFESNSKNILAQNICTEFDPFEIALSRKRLEQEKVPDHIFSKKIKKSGYPVGNQKSSGRCWIFACLNVIRVPFMKKYSIKNFEFSQAYLFFWDKIERSNFFLNTIVSTAKNGHTLNSRTVMSLLENPVEDGGYWFMAANIIKKHGLMPKNHFRESYNSENSDELNEILNSKLREFAVVLHRMVRDKLSDRQISNEIKKYMCIVYQIVGICLDIPKVKFKWQYRSGNEMCECNITPLEFYEKIVRPVFDVENKVSLISDPRPKNRYGRLYTLDLVGNVVGGTKILYNNQPIEVLMEACKRSIDTLDEPIWYTCEVNQRFSSDLGFEDIQILDFQSLFNTDISIPMTKSDRITYRDSSPTHAMIITGVLVEDGKVTRWRVENSWGKHTHHNGHLMMTSEWFKEYVFEVVVDKKILPEGVLNVFNQEPIVLPVWDQIGSFALSN